MTTGPSPTDGLPRSKEELVAALAENSAELRKQLSFKDVANILGSSIKRDVASKTLLFAVMLLTYTDAEALNALMAAESSSGKSYLPIEISLYFPEEDVVILGGASPTSFFHEVSGGDFATWDPEKKQVRVDLSHRILIFLDQPRTQLLEKLRSFLSHDKKEIRYKIADRSQKAGLRTKTIILVGYATVIFCTANFALDQQERTRVYQLSPETDTKKVDDAVELLLAKKSNRDAFANMLLSDPNRKLLMRRVKDVKNSGIRDVVIPEELQRAIARKWKELHPHPIPRHIRDLERFLSLVKARALLNWRLREDAGDHRVSAIGEDVDEAFAVYETVRESNELGLAPQIYEIFKEVIQPIGSAKVTVADKDEVVMVGVFRQQILREYFTLYGRPLSEQRLRKEILPPLDASGLISEEPDPDDRRRNLVYPQVLATISRAKGLPPASMDGPRNSGRGVGVSLNKPPCEVCGRPGTPLVRIGDPSTHHFCSEHKGDYRGDL